jgi:hypothetical protein
MQTCYNLLFVSLLPSVTTCTQPPFNTYVDCASCNALAALLGLRCFHGTATHTRFSKATDVHTMVCALPGYHGLRRQRRLVRSGQDHLPGNDQGAASTSNLFGFAHPQCPVHGVHPSMLEHVLL